MLYNTVPQLRKIKVFPFPLSHCSHSKGEMLIDFFCVPLSFDDLLFRAETVDLSSFIDVERAIERDGGVSSNLQNSPAALGRLAHSDAHRHHFENLLSSSTHIDRFRTTFISY